MLGGGYFGGRGRYLRALRKKSEEAHASCAWLSSRVEPCSNQHNTRQNRCQIKSRDGTARPVSGSFLSGRSPEKERDAELRSSPTPPNSTSLLAASTQNERNARMMVSREDHETRQIKAVEFSSRFIVHSRGTREIKLYRTGNPFWLQRLWRVGVVKKTAASFWLPSPAT